MVNEHTQTNVATFDVWTIPHFVAGYAANRAGFGFIPAFWIALAFEAVEIGVSNKWPELARETRSNQLGDLAAFTGGYMIGGK